MCMYLLQVSRKQAFNGLGELNGTKPSEPKTSLKLGRSNFSDLCYNYLITLATMVARFSLHKISLGTLFSILLEMCRSTSITIEALRLVQLSSDPLLN